MHEPTEKDLPPDSDDATINTDMHEPTEKDLPLDSDDATINTEQLKPLTTAQLEFNAQVNRIIEGDNEPWDQVYRAFIAIAIKYSRRLPPHVRKDFLSDMGQRLLTCLTEGKWHDTTGIPFEAWIHKTGYYAVGEWWRKLERLSAEVQDPEFPYENVEDGDISTEDRIIQQEGSDALWDLVRRLPDTYAKVIYWHYAREMSFSEIGEKLGKNEDNCRKIHERAKKSLRQLMHDSDFHLEKEDKD